MKSNKKWLFISSLVLLTAIWLGVHYAGVTYGTHDIPLHQSYVGDEQAPVNGALHILADKSLLGLRNLHNVYYGPVFSVIALPAVVGDFAYRTLTGAIHGAAQYQNYILWNWGGIITGIRIITVLASLLGLIFVYKILMLPMINARRNRWLALTGVSLLAINFYYFEYSHFFKHWMFIMLLFIIQLYVSLRMMETGGHIRWHWWIHGALTVISFGISYIGIVYLIAFVPLAWKLWRDGGKVMRLRLFYYAIGVILGGLVMIAWHPYAFIRILGFIGVGSKAGALNNVQNPFAFGQMSFGYYLNELLWNNLSIIIALIVLAFTLIRNKIFRGDFQWVWMFGSAAVVNFFIFALASHHEGRYMLPTIVLIIIAVAAAFIRYVQNPVRSKSLTVIIAALLIIYAGFHLVFDIKWIQIYAKGPAEQDMIKQALTLEQDNQPILLVQDYIAGHGHTRDAYQAYMAETNKEDVNLYKELIAGTPPAGIKLLNARYVSSDGFFKDPTLVKKYSHIIVKYNPKPDEINQFDYFDENVFRLWYYADFTPSYKVSPDQSRI